MQILGFRNSRPVFAATQRGAGPRRAGLTLVELLVTISIIAILSSIFLGALQSASEEAKQMKTKSMIVKLNNLIMPRYDAYRTRRVPINIAMTGASGNSFPLSVAARFRLDALHELMRLEMPDRMTDIVDPPISISNPNAPAANQTTIARPALNQAYYQALLNSTHGAPPVVLGNINAANQGAECLYMIVTFGFVDELGGRDLFNEGSIGDTDGDGLSEFLDAWGTPIAFLRWCPGFTESELNGGGGTLVAGSGPNLVAAGAPVGIYSYGLARRNNAYVGKTITVYNPTATAPTPVRQIATITSSFYIPVDGTTQITTNGNFTVNGGETFGIDPDPFDPMQVYPNSANMPFNAVPFAIYPLIYSAGADRTFGVLTDFSATTPLKYNWQSTSGSTLFPNGVYNYPFLTDTMSGDNNINERMGTTKDITTEQSAIPTWESSGWLDNIHNHLIGLR